MNEIDKMCERNMGLIPFVINRMGLNKFEDELTDICYIALVNGCKTYNGSVTESTYLYACIRYACICHMKFLQRQCRDLKISKISLDTQVGDDTTLGDLITNGEDEMKIVELNEIYEYWLNVIHEVTHEGCQKGDRNEQMYLSYVNGCTKTAIGDKYGITRERASQIINRLDYKIRKKMKEYLN